MHLLCLLLATGLVSVFGIATNAQVYVPPHVPMTIVTPTPIFNVPWWLGGFIATTNTSAAWILPLTYPNGGRTNVGSTLVIQNQGPYNITLYSTPPETVQGSGSYLILADSTVSLLCAQDWIVVSNVYGTTSLDGNFGYLQAQTLSVANTSVTCDMVIGNDWDSSYLAQAAQCGDVYARYMMIGRPEGVTTVPRVSRDPILQVAKRTAPTGGSPDYISVFGGSRYLSYLLPAGVPTSLGLLESVFSDGGNVTQILGTRAIGITSTLYGPVTAIGSTQVINIDYQLGANWTGVIPILRMFRANVAALTGSSGSITVYEPFYAPAVPTVGVTTGTARMFRCDVVGGGTTSNACFSTTERTGGTSNAAYHIDSNSATCGAGLVAGTAFDVCLYRGAAGTWLIQNSGGTGASLWVSKYMAVGATAAPSNTAAGAFSTTKSSPALQAFGAVTANAASGVLAFTVSTAAASCATAVVTNTNVVAGSEVILTVQSYTGTDFTNGNPVVSRQDTAGSSAGSFTLKLCNLHSTNALSGNLYIAFWVLN